MTFDDIRKKELITVCKTLNIKYSNKSKDNLICILEKLDREQRCYNNKDPITLEDLSNISTSDYIEWYQVSKIFGSSKKSIIYMFENKMYNLPWNIDFTSSDEKNKNIDLFNTMYDMRNIKILKHLYESNDIVDCNEHEDVNGTFDTWFRFALYTMIENDLYIDNVITYLLEFENINEIYTLIFESMTIVLEHLRLDATITQYITYYNEVYINYVVLCSHLTEKSVHLTIFCKMLEEYKKENDNFVINLLFIEMQKNYEEMYEN